MLAFLMMVDFNYKTGSKSQTSRNILNTKHEATEFYVLNFILIFSCNMQNS